MPIEQKTECLANYLADQEISEIPKLKSSGKKDIRWAESVHSVWKSLHEEAERFSKSQMLICDSPYDDAETKWWLSATIEGDSVVLYLETPESIIASESVATKESLVVAIMNMLDEYV